MKKPIRFLLFASLMLPAANAFAATNDNEDGRPGTVDYFTPAQEEKAFAEAKAAGYIPTIVEAYQDGNFFLTATKDGGSYEVTVARSGQVYPATTVAPAS